MTANHNLLFIYLLYWYPLLYKYSGKNLCKNKVFTIYYLKIDYL